MSPVLDAVDQRLKSLEAHLAQENPVLLSTVQSFRAWTRSRMPWASSRRTNPTPIKSPGGP
jgi:hypothetical protein